MGKLYRQRDVLFREVDELPKKKRKLDTEIIVRGEATGHAHRIQNGILFSTWDRGPHFYIKANKDTKIIHEEHDPIELEPGIYEVIRMREYDPNAPVDPWVED